MRTVHMLVFKLPVLGGGRFSGFSPCWGDTSHQ